MTSYNEKAICLEDPTIVNIYVPQIRAHKNVKQILTNMKGKVDSNTIIIENFKTPLSSLDHLDKKSIRTLNLNYMLDQMDPTDIHRTFHQRAAEYTLSSAYGTFSRINYMLGTKQVLTNLIRLKSHQIFVQTTVI